MPITEAVKLEYKDFTILSDIVFINSKKYSWSVHVKIGTRGAISNSNFPRGYSMGEYYLNNQDKIKKRSVAWNKNNKKQKAHTNKEWYNNNKRLSIDRAVKWNKENIERRREISAKHSRFFSRKYKARRKNMGFVELNTKFENSHAHHVDNEQVVYIPEKLHRSVSHNLKTGRGMQTINALAFKYLFSGGW